MFITVLLCGAGLVMVTSASVAFAYTQHQSAFYYAERQAAWMLIGFAGLFLLGRIDYRRLRPLAPAGGGGGFLLMLLGPGAPLRGGGQRAPGGVGARPFGNLSPPGPGQARVRVFFSPL